ncbi:MAG TPA: PKD domain-containing protein, partial [Flavobacteriales bacterium]|nr:PKD domain-containing protein [Flavobacteriales bacterium]
GSENFGAVSGDLALAKIDSTGAILFSNIYGVGGANVGNSVTEAFDGGFISGGVMDDLGDPAAGFIKFDNTGAVEYAKRFNTSGGVALETITGVVQLADSSFAFAGEQNSSALTMRVGKTGNSCNGILISPTTNGAPYTVISETLDHESAASTLTYTSETYTPEAVTDIWKICEIWFPVAQTGLTNNVICQGTCVQFFNYFHTTSFTQTYQWSFPGGNPSTSTDPYPIVCYDTIGVYDITFTVTNPAGTATTYAAGYVNVYGFATGLTFKKKIDKSSLDNAYYTSETNDGGFVTCGKVFTGGLSAYDAYIAKHDMNGTLEWQKVLGDGAGDFFTAVKQTTDGGYIAVGASAGAGSDNVWMVKFNASGGIMWSKRQGSGALYVPNDVIQAADGTYAIVGSTSASITGAADPFIMKFDASGGFLDVHNYDSYNADQGKRIIQTFDGGFAIAGIGYNVAGEAKMLLVKVASDLSVEWSGLYGGNADDHGASVKQTDDGGFILGGYTAAFGHTSLDTKPLLVKVNSIGDVVWSKTYGTSGIHAEQLFDVSVACDQGFIMMGQSNGVGIGGDDVFLIKTDREGNTEWARGYGDVNNEVSGNAVWQTNDGGYAFAYTENNGTDFDIAIIKTDFTGESFCGTSSIPVVETPVGAFLCCTLTDDQSIGSLTPNTYMPTIVSGSITETNDCLACPEPVSNFTGSVSGATLSLTSTSANATGYLWNFGDGNTSTVANPVHTYALGGTYNVCLTVTSSCGDSTICQLFTTTCVSPVAGFSISQSGMNISTADMASNATTYTWDFGDGYTTNTPSASHTYFASGTYTICQYVNNGCGYDTLCQTVNIICNVPLAATSYSVSGLTVTFTNTSTDNANNYWDFDDGGTSTNASPVYVFSTAGSYDVELVVENACGTDTLVVTIPVNCVLPVAGFQTSPDGLTVEFVSSFLTTDATSVVWDFGEGGSSINPNPTYTYATTGTYTVCLIASNGCGSDTICTTVDVCAAPTAAFTWSASALNAIFTETSSQETSYYWTFGDGNATNLANPANMFSTAGTYEVCLVAINDCGTDTTCQDVYISCAVTINQDICQVTVDPNSNYNRVVWSKPAVLDIDKYVIYREIAGPGFVPIDTVPYTDYSIYVDSIFVPVANPNVTYYNYGISAIDTCGYEGPMSPAHTTIHMTGVITIFNEIKLDWTNYIGAPVNYYVILRDSMGTGNWQRYDSVPGSTLLYVDVNPPSLTSTNYVIETNWGLTCSPTRAGISTSRSNIRTRGAMIVDGINETGTAEVIDVYPNPANQEVTIELNRSNCVIRLYDSRGALVTSRTNTSRKTIFNISELSNGVYYFDITGAGFSVKKKFVKN